MLLTLNKLQLDEKTHTLHVDGQPILKDGAYTEFGHVYKRNEIKILNRCLDLADEEVRFVQASVNSNQDDPDELAILQRILAKSISDRNALAELKAMEERLYLKYADAEALTVEGETVAT